MTALGKLGAALFFSASLAAAEPVTVVALGDSLTAGYGLAPEVGFVPQMQGWLDAAGAEAVLINAGVSGDTSQGGLARLDWALSPGADALIVNLGANDMLRGIDPGVTRANLNDILDEARILELPVLLVGVEAAGNYGLGYKREFDSIFPELADEHDALFGGYFFEPLAEAVRGGEAMAAVMQGDGLHPNEAGVALVVEALGPKVLELLARVG